ncbi:MAG TPA: hypothetical protein VEU08_05615 [Vicinamibacterales bacterium]|nr:hypothetical protein [Vicinamibacterales bacterium]
MKCMKCGSERVVPRARVIDRGNASVTDSVRVGVARNPDAILFKDYEVANLNARVCGDCGHVELFVDEGLSMFQAFVHGRDLP